jgi:hypothetical protein
MAASFGVESEANLRCIYCGTKENLMLDHLNATIIDNEPSGFFAECANLVPSCGTCNFGKGNTPWELWIRAKGQERNGSANVIEERVAVIRPFSAAPPGIAA